MSLTGVLTVRVDGRPIALARGLLALALAVCVLEVAVILSGIAEGKLRYPGISVLPAPTADTAQAFLIVGLLAAALILLGLCAGVAAAAGSMLLTVALLWDQQTYSNHLVLVILLLAYLSFSRSGGRWGVAALGPSAPPTVPWWPQLLMLTQVTVLYLFAGLSKINPVFLSGRPLQGWLWLDLPDWIFPALSVATILTELFLAFALWVPKLRVLAVLVGVAFHASIVLGITGPTVSLVAFAAASVSSYWLFLARPSLSAALDTSAARAESRSPLR